LRQGLAVVAQVHVIDKHAMRRWDLASEQGRTHRTAHWAATDGSLQVDTASLQSINMWRPHIGVASVPKRMGSPLVAKDK
jgi:hypothetical protein